MTIKWPGKGNNNAKHDNDDRSIIEAKKNENLLYVRACVEPGVKLLFRL